MSLKNVEKKIFNEDLVVMGNPSESQEPSSSN